jgi:hypothetical protein
VEVFPATPLLIKDQLNLVLPPSSTQTGYTVHICGVSFGSSVAWPQAIAVAVPDGLSPQTPVSFMVYIQNTPLQQVSDFYQWFDPPWGWDWLIYQFWRWLNYTNLPIRDEWGSFQLPQQIAQAHKKCVLVIPQIPRAALASDPAQFRFLSGAIIKETLLSIRGLLLPDHGLDHVVLAAFSDGNNVLSLLLGNNLAKSAAAADREFLTGDVHEIYIFDPPQVAWAGNAVINASLAWKAAGTNSVQRVIRLYSQHFYSPGYYKLLPDARAKGLTPGACFFGESPGKEVTLAYLPLARGNDVWTKAGPRYLPGVKRAAVTWENVHHWIPGLFMADAAGRSPYM